VLRHNEEVSASLRGGDVYYQHFGFWHRNELGLNTGPARRIVANTWLGASLGNHQRLTEPQCWATLDYATVEAFSFGERLASVATRSRTAHGLVSGLMLNSVTESLSRPHQVH
jgi:hypothetical protein